MKNNKSNDQAAQQPKRLAITNENQYQGPDRIGGLINNVLTKLKSGKNENNMLTKLRTGRIAVEVKMSDSNQTTQD